jgi:methyl-accepting chemotaxis protein
VVTEKAANLEENSIALEELFFMIKYNSDNVIEASRWISKLRFVVNKVKVSMNNAIKVMIEFITLGNKIYKNIKIINGITF